MKHCTSCGHSIDDPLAQACPNCTAPLPTGDEAERGISEGGEPPSPGSSVPFEDTSLPFLERFIATVKLAFTNPAQLFSNMPEEEIGPPLIYGVVVSSIGAVVGLVWQTMFGGMAAMFGGGGEEFAVSTGLYVVIAIFMPLFAAIGIFISAGIYHLMLMLLGGANRGFGTTLRAVCYGYTPNLLGIIPICGGFVGSIWGLVLVILGGMYGHRTDAWRAVLAYFLPIVACCCLALGLASMLGVFGAMANGG